MEEEEELQVSPLHHDSALIILTGRKRDKDEDIDIIKYTFFFVQIMYHQVLSRKGHGTVASPCVGAGPKA